MAIRKFKPYTPGTRQRVVTDFSKTFFEPSGKVIIGITYFSISKNPSLDLTLFRV